MLIRSLINKNVTTLRYLDVSNNSSWYEENPLTYTQVLAVIKLNPRLEYINISNNGYRMDKTNDLVAKMNENLEENLELYGGLQELHMDGFNLDNDETLQELVCILSGCPGLQKFSCRNQTG